MLEFYFIRHAQSSNNALYDRTGSSLGRSHDPEITALGKAQARALAEELALERAQVHGHQIERNNRHGYYLTHLYSSLMQRALQTGSVVAERLGLPLLAWVDIHESGGLYLEDETTGHISGMSGFTRAELLERFPRLQLPDLPFENGWWGKGLETAEESRARAQRFIQELLERHAGKNERVAIVSHGAFYNLFLSTLLKVPLESNIWFRLNNVAITRVDFLEEEVGLGYLNHNAFLPPELLS